MLDAKLQEIGKFNSGSGQIIPGDTGLLVRSNSTLTVRWPGKPDRILPIPAFGVWSEARFVSEDTIVGLTADGTATASTKEGETLYRISVPETWNATIIPSVGGGVFGISRSGYTALNSLLHFYDIESSRPADLQMFTIYSAHTGKLVQSWQWDPRPFVGHLSPPAISPSGDKVAFVDRGFLELYGVN